MIDGPSIKHNGLAELWSKGKTRKIKQDLIKRVKSRLALLNAAPDPEALRAFPELALHELKGRRKGVYSIKVSGPWRITFKYQDQLFRLLDLEQYH